MPFFINPCFIYRGLHLIKEVKEVFPSYYRECKKEYFSRLPYTLLCFGRDPFAFSIKKFTSEEISKKLKWRINILIVTRNDETDDDSQFVGIRTNSKKSNEKIESVKFRTAEFPLGCFTDGNVLSYKNKDLKLPQRLESGSIISFEFDLEAKKLAFFNQEKNVFCMDLSANDFEVIVGGSCRGIFFHILYNGSVDELRDWNSSINLSN